MCDISWFVQWSCIACINGCCLTNGGNICVQWWWWSCVMTEACYECITPCCGVVYFIKQWPSLLTYEEIVSMATAEWNPWTNTINELNTNPTSYYTNLLWHYSTSVIDFWDYWEHEYIQWISNGRWHIFYYQNEFVAWQEWAS